MSAPNLHDEIAAVLNRYSVENRSDTPDFLLAEYLQRCLDAAEYLVNRRDAWYGVTHRLGAPPVRDVDLPPVAS